MGDRVTSPDAQAPVKPEVQRMKKSTHACFKLRDYAIVIALEINFKLIWHADSRERRMRRPLLSGNGISQLIYL